MTQHSTPARFWNFIPESDFTSVNLISEGNFVEANEPVKVVKVEGSRIVVRELKKE